MNSAELFAIFGAIVFCCVCGYWAVHFLIKIHTQLKIANLYLEAIKELIK